MEKYDSSSDLHCCFYSLSNDYSVIAGDRIVLFKLGWQQITDYELFEWAPKLQPNEKATVIFKGNYMHDIHLNLIYTSKWTLRIIT